MRMLARVAQQPAPCRGFCERHVLGGLQLRRLVYRQQPDLLPDWRWQREYRSVLRTWQMRPMHSDLRLRPQLECGSSALQLLEVAVWRLRSWQLLVWRLRVPAWMGNSHRTRGSSRCRAVPVPAWRPVPRRRSLLWPRTMLELYRSGRFHVRQVRVRPTWRMDWCGLRPLRVRGLRFARSVPLNYQLQ